MGYTKEQIYEELFLRCKEKSEQPNQANFLSDCETLPAESKVIFRSFATLTFVFIVDEDESELGILDLIQVFVEVLDSLFKNVCEVDLVFNPHKLGYVLDEIIVDGLVCETSIDKVCSSVQQMDTVP